ncbi:ATP-binding protein, partial [Algoriphagus sp. AGSA1]|nr:ATP-binding protein [Algoriphagus sp. AGSA1]
NNPVGYVFSNLKTLAGYMQDMLKIIDATDHVDSMSELHQLKKALDYDYIRQDVPALLRESEEGMDRIKHIISALKYFSHTDDDSFRLADLHQSIESTLTVAGNEIKYRAQVIKQFGVLPHVQFNVSQINQVVMNLLINAAQSIENSGMITLRTDQDGAWVWFEVEDTGCGMTPEVQQRIFEPFYTTKPVGQGTGMGLALSYGIVQKHNGRIDVFSRVGHGTRIRVWLPVHQPNV